MAYEPNPGWGSIFKNTDKRSDKAPDYRGTIKTPDGDLYEIAGWIKEGRNGGRFINVKVQQPLPEGASERGGQQADDDIPF